MYLDWLVHDKRRPADVREKRAEWIRQSRWLWIRLVSQGEKTEEAGGFVFLVGGVAS
ncbi:hypothetical protein HanRHA438_Chr15g0711631 [Helianthus annuus]|nr:hypothetical protein HanIR_Chr15g0760511 [Helianthus annuus]KAJ0845260.1 hypothetical protein HanRHA438_Chr15g0711631 [Helianthus annuus]